MRNWFVCSFFFSSEITVVPVVLGPVAESRRGEVEVDSIGAKCMGARVAHLGYSAAGVFDDHPIGLGRRVVEQTRVLTPTKKNNKK